MSLTTTGTMARPALLGGAPAALAGDDLVPVAHPAGHDGLDHAVGLQAGGQVVQEAFVEVDAGLVAVGHQGAHRHFPVAGVLGGQLAHEGGEAAAQGGSFGVHAGPPGSTGSSRPSHSRARFR